MADKEPLDLAEDILDGDNGAAAAAESDRFAVTFHPIKLRATTKKTREYHGRMIRAGFTRNLLNEPTDLFVTPEAIHDGVNAGLFEGLACFVDHSSSQPSIRNLLGSWHSASFDSSTQSATATLSAYVTDDTRPIIDRLDQILAAGPHAPDVGVSLVFYPRWKNTTSGERHVASFKQIESADIVFFPAADGRILEALSALSDGGNQMSDQVQTAEKETAVTVEKAKERATLFAEEAEKIAEEQEALAAQHAARADAWSDEVAQHGMRTILNNSGLPEPIIKRLSRNRYETPDDLHKAIQDAREELQALDKEEVIDLGERPWIYVKDPIENLQSHVDWFFGVEGTPLPPTNYRRLDQLYVALTGDSAFQGVFQRDRVTLASANTTTLANMAVDAMNKVVPVPNEPS